MRLSSLITEANRASTVKLRGLPYECQPFEIVDLFREYKITESDVVIEIERGQGTGFALIFFKS